MLKIVEKSFQNLPERLPTRLKQILIDLETNFRVINCIETGIEIDREKLDLYETQIYENYSEKEQEYLQKYIFLARYTFIQYLSLFHSFNHFFPIETTNKIDLNKNLQTQKKTESLVSSATQNDSVGDNIREKREDSLGHLPNIRSRGGEGGDVASIEEIPLTEFGQAIEKPQVDLGVFIDKDTLKHFQSLVISLDPRDEDYKKMVPVWHNLFTKIEQHFRPVYNNQNWTWIKPSINIGAKKRSAYFTIRMTSTGFFEITLNRKNIKNVGIKNIVNDILTIFNFLEREEREQLLLLFKLTKRKKKAFVHLANRLFDEDGGSTIQQTLKGAIVKVSYIDIYGEDIARIKVDYSDGPEIEIEGEESTSLNLNTIIVEPAKVQKTLRGMADNLENIMDILYGYALKEVNYSVHLSVRNNKLIKQIKRNIRQLNHGQQDIKRSIINLDVQNSVEYVKLGQSLSNVNSGLNQQSVILENVQSDLSRLEQAHIPELHNKLDYLYDEANKFNIKSTNALIDISKGLGRTAETLIDVKDELHTKIDHRHNQTERLVIDATRELRDEIDKKFKSFETVFRQTLATEFKAFSKKFRNNLQLIIRKLYHLPGLAAKELASELNRSRSSVYRYLSELQQHNMIEPYSVKINKKGRYARLFKLTQKFMK